MKAKNHQLRTDDCVLLLYQSFVSRTHYLRETTPNSYENKTNFNSASSLTPGGDCCAEGRIRAGKEAKHPGDLGR